VANAFRIVPRRLVGLQLHWSIYDRSNDEPVAQSVAILPRAKAKANFSWLIFFLSMLPDTIVLDCSGGSELFGPNQIPPFPAWDGQLPLLNSTKGECRN
jgi:hypothetical protein